MLKWKRSLLGIAICVGLACGMCRAAAAAEEAPADVVKLIFGLLGEKDKDLRAIGLEQIRKEAKGEAATKEFAAQLAKLPADAQTGLLSALAERGDAAARPAVVELLKAAADEPVKIAAIEAVGALGEGDDAALLIPLLSSGSKAQKSAARAALVRLRGDGVPAALAAVLKETQDVPLRVALIKILTARRSPDSIPELVAAAASGNQDTRAAAMAALAKLAEPDQLPAMLKCVLRSAKGPERDAAERAIVQVCSRIPDPTQRAAAVLKVMNKLHPSNSANLLPTLGRLGDPAGLPMIEESIADDDPPFHKNGLRAICNWPDATVADRLIKIYKADGLADEHAMVLSALIRIAPLADGRTDDERLALLKKVMGMCSRSEDQNLVISRARAIYTVESLRFVVPYLDEPDHAQAACETVVELAHHRDVRDANKPEFHAALDKVIELSKDEVVVDRANRYKEGKTWARPKAEDADE